MVMSACALRRSSAALRWRLAQASPRATSLTKTQCHGLRTTTSRTNASVSEILARRRPDGQRQKNTDVTNEGGRTKAKEESVHAGDTAAAEEQNERSATTFARNHRLREIYASNDAETERLVQEKLSSPFVPSIRTYPNQDSTNESMAQARKTAKMLVAEERIWADAGKQTPPSLSDILNVMKQMGGRKDGQTQVEAMRVILPEGTNLTLASQRLEFVESATGLIAKMNMSADQPNMGRGLIIRGDKEALARAADELIGYNSHIKVFQLGNVTTFDYDTRQLWPSLPYQEVKVLDGKDSLKGSIWVHREVNQRTINYPYEQTKKPDVWTKETFHNYVSTLIENRLQTSLAARFYPPKTDTDGIRVQMIFDTFNDPELRHCITPPILNAAISFMMWRGGHRATAEKLFTSAQAWGVPVDTTTFNIMLGGYVTIRATGHFHRVLEKMRDDYFVPNIRTWIHVLRLVARDDERRQIIVTMYDHGAFDDPAARREIAKIMAQNDLHQALKQGLSLSEFAREQADRYGEDWFTTNALIYLVEEFLMFKEVARPLHSSLLPRTTTNTTIESTPNPSAGQLSTVPLNDLKALFDRQPEDGVNAYSKPVLAMLRAAARQKDWDLALYALDLHSQLKCQETRDMYALLVDLAIRTECPHVLSSLLIHGIVTDQLGFPTRRRLQDILTGRNRHSFWHAVRPHCFDQGMLAHLNQCGWLEQKFPFRAVQDAVLRALGQMARPAEGVVELVRRAYTECDVPWRREWKAWQRTGKEAGEPRPKMRAVKMEFRSVLTLCQGAKFNAPSKALPPEQEEGEEERGEESLSEAAKA